MEEKIVIVLNEMSEYLSITQMKKLQEVIIKTFADNEASKVEISNEEFLKMFLDAKRIEGCSERTIIYYQATVKHLLSQITTEVRKITTEEIREYLSKYQKWNNCSNVTIDNVRRNISSFFSWLEEEDYILKSPMKRIHKIKTKTVVKSVISDEGIEKLRDNCNEKRDLAIIDLLYSTGIRVGELVNLNIDDIDLEGRECIVYGKGDKERRVYFDAKAKVHLKEYIDNRTDNNNALFVTLDAPHDRLKISGVEIRLRNLAKEILRVSEMVKVVVADTITIVKTEDMNELEPLQEKGLQIKKLTDQITEYLAALFSAGTMTEQQAAQTASLMYILSDVERMGTLSVEVAKCVQEKIENRYKYTPEAMEELQKSLKTLEKMFTDSIKALQGDKSVQTEKLIKRKDKIMDLDLKMRKAHVQRVNKGKCKASLTTPFTNILHLIDRMGNSCVNLADVASNEISLKYFMVN